VKRRVHLFGLSLLLAACGDEVHSLDAGTQNDATVAPDASTPADADTGAGLDAQGADAQGADVPVVIDPGTGRIDLGTVTLVNGSSESFDFELPSELDSFMIVIRGAEDSMFVVRHLDGPTGTLVTPDIPSEFLDVLLGPFPSQYKSPNRVVAQREGISAALFPNNPSVSVGAGSYTASLGGVRVTGQQTAPASGTVNVEVFYKVGSASSGRIDVGLYFSGAGGLSADSAPASPLMNAALEKLRTVYAQIDIEIGTVSYHDISSSCQTISSLSGPGNQLNEMFKLSQATQRGLHFFFVDRIESPLGGVIGGVAGGLPGPPSGQGTTGAGVAVALAAANGDANLLGHVMSHEGGHWLGLSHTTESLLPGIEDQLPDTPAGQAGTSNVMYPDGNSTGALLSPNQGSVMRRHLETVSR
jgi:hypothetical protein